MTIDAATTINASATSVGNGGKVIVWADGDTTFAGTILARGGASGGNGGFVEVSGKQTLAISGFANMRGPLARPARCCSIRTILTIADSRTSA